MKKTIESPALHMIRHVREHKGNGMGRSNERQNQVIDEAIRLAIGGGLRFDVGDFKALATPSHQSYYAKSFLRYHDQEGHYSAACGRDRGRENMSAALAFEAWSGRKPFLIRQDPDVKTATRVYVGCQFQWYGQRVKATSFNDEAGSFTACTYKGREEVRCDKCGQIDWDKTETSSEKIDKRHTITHEAIKEYHAALKLEAELNATVGGLSENTRAILLGKCKDRFGDRFNRHGMTVKELTWIQSEIEKLAAAKEKIAV